MGKDNGSLGGNGNNVKETWELNGKWECSYRSERKWEFGTHSRSPVLGSCSPIPVIININVA